MTADKDYLKNPQKKSEEEPMKIRTVEQALAEAMLMKLDANIATLAQEGIPIPTLEDLVDRNTAGMEEQPLSPDQLSEMAAMKAMEE